MRVMLKGLSPGMEHGEEADPGPQVLGVRGDGLQGFRRGLKEDAVDHLLILVGYRGDLFRHGEHDMKVLAVEKFRLPVLKPLRPSQTLAFGTMPIPAAIVGVAFVATLIATFQVAAESGGT